MSGLMKMMEIRSTGINQILNMNHAEFSVECQETFKNNGLLNGFCLRSDSRSTSPVVYMTEELLEKSDTELANYFMEVFARNTVEITGIDKIMTKDYIMTNARPRLLSSSNTDDMDAKGIAYKRMMDIPLVVGFYMVLSSTRDETASVTIRTEHLKLTGIEIDDLWRAAISNMNQECVVQSMFSVLEGLMGEIVPINPDIPEMWVVTNKNKLFGAAAILCPNTIEELTNKLGGQFIILSSSIHELICIPSKGADPNYLSSMVAEINRTLVSNQDKLCDQVFKYEDGMIKVL